MKPRRIILVRHGESEGNASRGNYEFIPDYALNLTTKGVVQARQAGQAIKQLIGDESLYVYLSPYDRARQTWQQIKVGLEENVLVVMEDPRIREQDWGHLQKSDLNEKIDRDRDQYSPFYYRIPDGESGADVYDRVSTFLETLHRDFAKLEYPPNMLIVTHGMTLRLFLMRWFHWTVEEFENLRNPHNGQVVVMERNNDGQYHLISELAKRG
jgi:broad specificity phosphatase PhoE